MTLYFKHCFVTCAIFFCYSNISAQRHIPRSGLNFVTGNVGHIYSITDATQQQKFGKKLELPANYVDVILIPASQGGAGYNHTMKISSLNNKPEIYEYISKIAGAHISMTDSQGSYLFDNVPNGRYLLITKSIAKKDTALQIYIGEGNVNRYKISNLIVKD